VVLILGIVSRVVLVLCNQPEGSETGVLSGVENRNEQKVSPFVSAANHSGRNGHDERRKEITVVQASAVRFVSAGLYIQQGAKRMCACQHLSDSKAFFRGRKISF
jgi:hypothetical protein